MSSKIKSSVPSGDDHDCALNHGYCGCGLRGGQKDSSAASSEEELCRSAVESAVVRAVFPLKATRRALISAIGKAALVSAVSEVFPLANAIEAFAANTPVDIQSAKVGFIPITCCTPLVLARAMGIYSKYGLRVELVKTPGWAVIRERAFNKEYDASFPRPRRPARRRSSARGATR